MNSIINEIIKLRSSTYSKFDLKNQNQYCVVLKESNGTKTSYCFSVPIYNHATGQLIDLQFNEVNHSFIFEGSSSRISIDKCIRFENDEGKCNLMITGPSFIKDKLKVQFGKAEISPTLNGLVFKVPLDAHQPYEIPLLSSQSFMDIRVNNRCFTLMSEKFKPFITVSCIGTQNSTGQITAPCEIDYIKRGDREFCLSINHKCPFGRYVLFEINMYEGKLFQDTTVESQHPDVNNAFGGTAFIGTTSSYGEQWLYSRPDFSRVLELYDKQVIKAYFHIPRLSGTVTLSAFGISSRFCSFGSNWENKKEETAKIAESYITNDYQTLDITDLISDKNRFLTPTEGIIIKTKSKNCGHTVISTGDSYFAPQILEINYR